MLVQNLHVYRWGHWARASWTGLKRRVLRKKATAPSSKKRSAMIYHRGAHFLAYPMSRTTDGVWISAEPVLKLDERASEEDIASIILRCLERSRLNVPHPTDWGSVVTPLLEQAGVKSWRMFVRDASCVTIDVDDGGTLVVIPMEKGPKGEFRGQLSSALSFRTDEMKDLGSAVRKLLT